MKILVKFIASIIALLMLLTTFVACGKKDDDNDQGNSNKETVAQTNNGSDGESEVTTVPTIEVKKWDGKEYRVLGRYSSTSWAINWEIWREDVPEDIIGQSINRFVFTSKVG